MGHSHEEPECVEEGKVTGQNVALIDLSHRRELAGAGDEPVMGELDTSASSLPEQRMAATSSCGSIVTFGGGPSLSSSEEKGGQSAPRRRR